MARKTLIFALAMLASCTTVNERITDSANKKGASQAAVTLPELPIACTVKVGRIRAGVEPWVVVQRRWESSADNRDQSSKDCSEWWADYRKRQAPR